MAEYTHPTPEQQQELTIKNIIGNTNICKPCRVVAVNATSPLTVDVQPCDTLKTLTDGQNATYTEMPILRSVPVVFPHAQTAGFGLTVPVAVGDTGLLYFADRALGNFKKSGKATPPQQDGRITNSMRSHSLTDAIYLAGMCWDENGFPDYIGDGVQMRDKAGEHSATVHGGDVVIKSTSNSTITTADAQIEIKHGDATITLTDSNITIKKGGCVIVVTGAGITMTNGGATMGMSGGTTTIDGNFQVNGTISASGNISTGGNVSATGTVHGSNI